MATVDRCEERVRIRVLDYFCYNSRTRVRNRLGSILDLLRGKRVPAVLQNDRIEGRILSRFIAVSKQLWKFHKIARTIVSLLFHSNHRNVYCIISITVIQRRLLLLLDFIQKKYRYKLQNLSPRSFLPSNERTLNDAAQFKYQMTAHRMLSTRSNRKYVQIVKITTRFTYSALQHNKFR